MNADELDDADLTISDEESHAAMRALLVIRGFRFNDLAGRWEAATSQATGAPHLVGDAP